jgi:hypothetical protein
MWKADKKVVLCSGTQGQSILNIYPLDLVSYQLFNTYRYTVWQYDGSMTNPLLMMVLILNILTLAGAKHS